MQSRELVVLLGALIVLAAARSARAESLLDAAADLGITPHSMLVAGATPAQAEEILIALEGATDERAQLEARRVDAHAAAEAATLLADAASMTEDADVHTAYEASLAALAAIQSEVASLRATLRNQVTNGLTTEQLQRLAAWRDAGPQRAPHEFRVATRTAESWQAIERALRAEARAIRRGNDLALEHAQVLLLVRAEPAVQVAAVAIATQWPAMAAVFDSE